MLFASLPIVCVVGYRVAYLLYWAAYGDRGRMSVLVTFALAHNVWGDLVMLLHLLIVGTTSVVANLASPLRVYPSIGAYAVAIGFAGLLLIGLAAAPSPTRRLVST